MSTYKISYDFKFKDDTRRTYEIELDTETMRLVSRDPAPPEWTKLDFHKCSHCPLKSENSPHCPIARNLGEVAEHFKQNISHHTAMVFVKTPERTFAKETDVQTGLQSIFGLIMATSGCPHMNFLKLMARFHLPFSSYEETLVRSISFYLLTQFCRARKNLVPDFEVKGLAARYEDVQQVNQGIIERLRSLGGGDADKNALVILDTFAALLPTEMSSDLSSLEGIVAASLADELK